MPATPQGQQQGLRTTARRYANSPCCSRASTAPSSGGPPAPGAAAAASSVAATCSSARSTSTMLIRTGSASRRGSGGVGVTSLRAKTARQRRAGISKGCKTRSNPACLPAAAAAAFIRHTAGPSHTALHTLSGPEHAHLPAPLTCRCTGATCRQPGRRARRPPGRWRARLPSGSGPSPAWRWRCPP